MVINKGVFNRIPNKLLFLALLFLISLKIIIFLIIKWEFISFSFSGGSDAVTYHRHAIGYTDTPITSWPVILRWLNDHALYSREGITYFLFFLNFLVIPVLSCKIAGLDFKRDQKNYLYLFLIISFYPILYFYSFDVYRDIFMVFGFLIGCLSVKRMLSTRNIIFSISLFILSLIIGLFLLSLRPYLGYAFLLSLLFIRVRFTKRRLILIGFLYTLVLYIAYSIGALDTLVEYRSGFDPDEGGSTLGLDFSNPVLFIPNLVLSILGQLFGLYITNPLALVLLVAETLPFIIMLNYIIKNIKLADSFARYLIIFFVLYASVWLIGNDNLGTAVRLRLFNYCAVYICFFYILNLKKALTFNKLKAI